MGRYLLIFVLNVLPEFLKSERNQLVRIITWNAFSVEIDKFHIQFLGINEVLRKL